MYAKMYLWHLREWVVRACYNDIVKTAAHILLGKTCFWLVSCNWAMTQSRNLKIPKGDSVFIYKETWTLYILP